MDNLLPGHLVLTFEHVLKLLEGVSPAEMDFLAPLEEIGDCFVDGELNAKSATVDVDFRFHFEAGIFVLHVLSFLWRGFLIPTSVIKGKERFLIDQGHLKILRQ